jgi:hypothetical protein
VMSCNSSWDSFTNPKRKRGMRPFLAYASGWCVMDFCTPSNTRSKNSRNLGNTGPLFVSVLAYRGLNERTRGLTQPGRHTY